MFPVQGKAGKSPGRVSLVLLRGSSVVSGPRGQKSIRRRAPDDRAPGCCCKNKQIKNVFQRELSSNTPSCGPSRSAAEGGEPGGGEGLSEQEASEEEAGKGASFQVCAYAMPPSTIGIFLWCSFSDNMHVHMIGDLEEKSFL